MFELNINSETGDLKKVVVGIARDRGKKVYENNPKISKHLKLNTMPGESDLISQVNTLAKIIENNGVEVLRPENVEAQDQIFIRDIGFVIGNKFVLSNMKKSNRKPEQDGILKILEQIDKNSLLTPPDNANIEGGDVILYGNYVFVGMTARTNFYGFEFIQNSFPDKQVVPFHMYVTDNPATNILHLDCAFQPVGENLAIIYENGFVHKPDIIYDIFGESNVIKVTQYEMYHMFPNIFSISPNLVITDTSFKRLNQILSSKGILTIEIDYMEVSKLGGLFRCSTMPLIRK